MFKHTQEGVEVIEVLLSILHKILRTSRAKKNTAALSWGRPYMEGVTYFSGKTLSLITFQTK